MKLASVENQITGIDGDLIFSGQQGDFQSRINMGKGSAGLAAKVNWSGHTLTNYKAAVQLEDLEVRSEYVRGPLNGELYIADRDGLPTLIGTLNLEKIQFKIPLSLQSSESTKDMGWMLLFMRVKVYVYMIAPYTTCLSVAMFILVDPYKIQLLVVNSMLEMARLSI